MSVKAKFECFNIEEFDESKTVYLQAVIGGSDENKEWSKWTPSGNISMNISNPAAYDKFVVGKEYYVTFENV